MLRFVHRPRLVTPGSLVSAIVSGLLFVAWLAAVVLLSLSVTLGGSTAGGRWDTDGGRWETAGGRWDTDGGRWTEG